MEQLLKQFMEQINQRFDNFDTNIQDVRSEIVSLKKGQAELTKEVHGLKEGQQQLRSDFNELKEGQQQLRSDVNKLQEGQQKLETGQQQLRSDFSELKEGQLQLQSDVTEIKLGQERLQKNIIDSIGTYTEKIAEHVDNRTDALNKRVYRLEIEVERMSRQ